MRISELKYGFVGVGLIFTILLIEYFSSLHDKFLFYYSFVAYFKYLIPAVLIVRAVRERREKFQGGLISFEQSLKTGLLITMIISVLWSALFFMYLELINPRFLNAQIRHAVDRAAASGQEMAEAARTASEQFTMINVLTESAGAVFLMCLLFSLSTAFLIRKDSKAAFGEKPRNEAK